MFFFRGGVFLGAFCFCFIVFGFVTDFVNIELFNRALKLFIDSFFCLPSFFHTRKDGAILGRNNYGPLIGSFLLILLCLVSSLFCNCCFLLRYILVLVLMLIVVLRGVYALFVQYGMIAAFFVVYLFLLYYGGISLVLILVGSNAVSRVCTLFL